MRARADPCSHPAHVAPLCPRRVCAGSSRIWTCREASSRARSAERLISSRCESLACSTARHATRDATLAARARLAPMLIFCPRVYDHPLHFLLAAACSTTTPLQAACPVRSDCSPHSPSCARQTQAAAPLIARGSARARRRQHPSERARVTAAPPSLCPTCLCRALRDVHGNRLGGAIPAALGQLSSLQKL